MIRTTKGWIAIGILALIAAFAIGGIVSACPFCSAVQLTLAQEMKTADAVVVAELVELPPKPAGADGTFPGGLSDPLVKSKFRILGVIKGADLLKKAKQIETVYFGELPVGTQFLITTVDPKNLALSQ